MQTKITKTIRVSIDVKQHLDEMKGSVSASEFIETMLSYFERNGVDPRTSINGKFKTLELQGIERIIKIIRAIEKDKIDKLLPAPEAHSDELLDRADKQVTQLKAEVERLKQAGAPDVEEKQIGTGCQAAGKRFRPEELQEGGKRNRLFCRTGLSGNVVI